MALKPWLVGELNPYGNPPEYDLYPHPRSSAGGRLCCKILGLERAEYLRRFERRNLCRGRWSMAEARKAAVAVVFESRGAPLILLGRRVATAFGYVDEPPFSIHAHTGRMVLLLPHPSGRCRIWNEAGAIEKARMAVASLLSL